MATSSPRSGRRPLRIGFDARYINDQYHGIGRYAYRLLEAMTAQAPEHTFVVFRGRLPNTRFDWQPLAARPNVELVEVSWPLYWPQEQLFWPARLRRSRVALFHSPYFVAPLLARTPVLVTVHDLIFDRYPEYMPMAWSRPYYQAMMALGTRKARRVIAVSQATAADLEAYYHIPGEKIAAIPEGVEPGFQAGAAEASRQDVREALRLRYHLSRPYLLAVGARRPHKNMANLVQAFASLPVQTHDLVFAGPADRRFPDAARELAVSLGLDGGGPDARVRFLDWVPEADLPALYSAADALIQPSLIEGFGLPALEAMACRTPVIASNCTSLPEVVGDAGILVDTQNVSALSQAIYGLISHPEEIARLRQAGARRAANFTWQAAAQKTLETYQEAIAGL